MSDQTKQGRETSMFLVQKTQNTEGQTVYEFKASNALAGGSCLLAFVLSLSMIALAIIGILGILSIVF
jgi:hypothetical protein